MKTIQQILKELNIDKYTIHDDGSVTAHQDVDMSNKYLFYQNPHRIPIKFRKIEGYFDCNNNNLVSLVGAPQIVEGHFWCSSNKLISLVNSPQVIEGSFHCSYNQLISLEGAPQIVKGNFNCSFNKLINLVGAPQIVKGDFYCLWNRLVSLEGAPQTIKGNFACCKKLKKDIIYKRYQLKKQIRSIE